MNLVVDDWDVKGLTGKVTVRMPTNGERMKIFASGGIDFLTIGEKLQTDDGKQQMLKLIYEEMDNMGSYCESVQLEIDGEKIESFDGIMSDSRLLSAQIKITTAVIYGSNAVLSKKKKSTAKK